MIESMSFSQVWQAHIQSEAHRKKVAWGIPGLLATDFPAVLAEERLTGFASSLQCCRQGKKTDFDCSKLLSEDTYVSTKDNAKGHKHHHRQQQQQCWKRAQLLRRCTDGSTTFTSSCTSRSASTSSAMSICDGSALLSRGHGSLADDGS